MISKDKTNQEAQLNTIKKAISNAHNDVTFYGSHNNKIYIEIEKDTGVIVRMSNNVSSDFDIPVEEQLRNMD
jgi:hypothetical protein